MKKLILVFLAWVAFLAPASTQIEIQSVTAKQDTQNGVVDVAVTLQGGVSDVAKVECSFVAVNVENGAAVPIEHITRSGDDEVAGGVWTRKFVWDAKNDVGMVKIDDVALTITVKMSGSLGCVQLWENGPYWADCNVGATKPEECGYYFWWGDTVGYVRNENNKGWISVSDLTGFSFSFGNCPTYDKTISQLCSLGYVDAEGILNPLHDAATSHLGAPWRMPTDAEIVSLISSCDTEWTTRNGVVGRLVKGRGAYSAKSIFLPAAGHGDGSSLNGLGTTGYYWSSTPYSRDYAWYLKFYSVYFYHESDRTWGEDRYTGKSIRPVRGCGGEELESSKVVATTHLQVDFRTDGGESAPEIEWSYVIRDGEATIVNGEKSAISASTIGDVVVPTMLGGCPVTKIGRNAFYGCLGLTSITLQNGVREIGENAFCGCYGLKTIILPTSLKTIGDFAFNECSALEEINIPAVQNMGEKILYNCKPNLRIFSDAPFNKWPLWKKSTRDYGCVTKILYDAGWPSGWDYDYTEEDADEDYDFYQIRPFKYVGAVVADPKSQWVPGSTYPYDEPVGGVYMFPWDVKESFFYHTEGTLYRMRWAIWWTHQNDVILEKNNFYPIVQKRYDASIGISPEPRTVFENRMAIELFPPHEDVELYYTIDGSDSVSNGVKYVQKFSIRGKTTVRAVGYYKGVLATKELVSHYGSGIVDAPVIMASQESFNFSKNRIAISCATPNVEIHFTTDGTEPTALSPIYSAPFTIDETTTVKAVAIGHPDYIDSEVVTRQFTRTWLTVPTPVISPGDGSGFDTVKGIVSIGCDIDGVTIYFTTDGSKPSRTSDVYRGQIEIDDDTTIQAYAVKDDYLDSPVAKATIYNRQPYAETPVISLAGGGASFVGSFGSVVMMSATDGATIHYTLDGTDPNEHSPIYSGPVSIVNTTIVKAYASKVGCRNSAGVTATFKKQWAYGDSLNCPDIMFKNDGGDWVNDPNVSYDGKGSLRSPLNPQDGKEYSFSTEVSGSQSVSFYWKTSCEKDEWDEFYYDHAEFWVDDELVAQLDGQGGWSYVDYNIEGGGNHILTWSYVKDDSGTAGADCVWIDSVLFGKRKTCQIVFDSVGGVCVELTRSVMLGGRIGELPVPVHGDKTFVGWYTECIGGTPVAETDVINDDLILYARWQGPSYLFNQSETIDGYCWMYNVIDGVAVIKSVSPQLAGNCSIPSLVGGFPVVEIGYRVFFGHSELVTLVMPQYLTTVGTSAFASCVNLRSITFYKGVKSIGTYAFEGCSSLSAVELPDGVENVGHGAFSKCSALRNVKLSDSIIEIGENAFFNCVNLSAVVLPMQLRRIGDSAFFGCREIEDITIPARVTDIGTGVFMYCDKLRWIDVDPENSWFAAEKGVLYTKDLRCILCCPAMCAGGVDLPASVECVGANAFWQCLSITQVRLPRELKTIGDYAFYYCSSLTNIDIPDGVTNVGEWAFCSCKKLGRIHFPAKLKVLGVSAFYDCLSLREAVFEGRPPIVQGFGAVFDCTPCVVYVCRDKGWDEYVAQGVYQGAPIKYLQVDPEGYDRVMIQGSDAMTILIDKSWHGQYSDFEKKFGEDILAAYLKETGKHDLSGNPMYVWQDYVAGTDPTDVNSVFKAKITMVGGKPKVEWEPNLNENGVVREYKVFGKENLTDAEWQSPISDQCKFFKVEVSMPK